MQSSFENELKKALVQEADTSAAEPLPGHEERFEMKLLQRSEIRRMRRLPRWPFIALAAASVITAIITIVVLEVKKTNDIADKARLSDVSPEMAAVETYYNERLQLDMPDVNTPDENIQRFMNDVKRLEEEYKRLEQTLASNFHNERIAQAMVNNYKYRLRLMEQLQKYIEIRNQINSPNHEQEMSS